MIYTGGNNIVGAYTNGVSVKEIYANGVKVWPQSSDTYVYYDYIEGRAPQWEKISSTRQRLVVETPIIILDIPYVSGGMSIESRIRVYAYENVSPITPIDVEGHYTDGDYVINGFWLHGGDYKTVSDAFTRGNYGCVQVDNRSIHNVKITIPNDSYNSDLYIDNKVYYCPGSEEKRHHTNPSAIEIRLLSSEYRDMECMNRLYYLKIKDSNNNLLYNYVPAVRTSDSAPGLYETINDTFHPRAPKMYQDSVREFLYGNN